MGKLSSEAGERWAGCSRPCHLPPRSSRRLPWRERKGDPRPAAGAPDLFSVSWRLQGRGPSWGLLPPGASSLGVLTGWSRVPSSSPDSHATPLGARISTRDLGDRSSDPSAAVGRGWGSLTPHAQASPPPQPSPISAALSDPSPMNRLRPNPEPRAAAGTAHTNPQPSASTWGLGPWRSRSQVDGGLPPGTGPPGCAVPRR